MTGAELISAAQNSSAVAGFIFGGGLETAVATVMGDIHADAAKLALTMSSNSNSPADRVKSAITHLEAALAAYRKVYARGDSSMPTAVYRMWESFDAKLKAAWAGALMAMCYAYLRDPVAVAKSIELARQAITGNRKEGEEGTASAWKHFAFVGLAGAMLLNPGTYKIWAAEIAGKGTPLISVSEIDSLAKSLEAVMLTT
jgi:hypothetical protein